LVLQQALEVNVETKGQGCKLANWKRSIGLRGGKVMFQVGDLHWDAFRIQVEV
jgi:hypothetical protein